MRSLPRVLIAALALPLLSPLVSAAGRDALFSPAPPALVVSQVWTSEIDLSWSTPDSVSTLTFEVEQSPNGVAFSFVDSVAHGTTAAIRDLDPGTTYWFRVRAIDANGVSPYSNVVQATTLACGPSAFMTAAPFAGRTGADLAKSTDWCGAVFDHPTGLRALRTQSDWPPCAAGGCDLPATRDGTPRDPIAVRVLVHVMRESDGSGGVSSALVDSMFAQMNRDFSPHRIRVDKVATLFHNDSQFATLATQQQLEDMKDLYAQTPSQNLNLFISGSALPFDGLGTLPWDPDALTPQGGLWLNRDLVDWVHHAASHELGHCLGLYHTFRGTDETESCAAACYEPASGANADNRGDLCADTRSTPRNFSCTAPGGCDCTGVPWGITPLHNIMGYGPWWCVNEFTLQQERRMLCWAHAALGSMIVNLAGVDPPLAERGDRGLWTAGMGEPSGSARLWYAVPAAGRVTLALYDVRGRRVATLLDRDEAEGKHELRWDGRDGAGERTSPGVYLLRLAVAGGSASGKLVLVH